MRRNHLQFGYLRIRSALGLSFLVPLLGATIVGAFPAYAQTTWYVDDHADPNGDGLTWLTAFDDLQAALDAAIGADEIWVAGGRYVPSQRTDPNDPRSATFQLVNGVALYGGYRGIDPNMPGDPNDRDPNIFESVLTGDLAGDDDPNAPFANNNENSYHVVYADGVGVTAGLDGFTISAGNANGDTLPHYYGGGMYNYYTSSTVANCAFSRNSAGDGGGMYNGHSSATVSNCTFTGNSVPYRHGGGMSNHYSSPTVADCTFVANWAGTNGGGIHNNQGRPSLSNCAFRANSASHGGGMYSAHGSPTLTDCVFDANTARVGGGLYNTRQSSATLIGCDFIGNRTTAGGAGAMLSHESSPLLVNCTFSGNVSAWNAGAMHSSDGSPTMINCTFAGNSSGRHGGAMYNWYHGSPTMIDCVFSGNSAAQHGGGIYSMRSSFPILVNSTLSGNWCRGDGPALHSDESRPTVTNCIVWENTPVSVPQIFGPATVTHSCIQGDHAGAGNIDADPLFVDPDGPDDDPNSWEDNDYRLGFRSPCIDAGDNTAVPPDSADLDGDGDTDEPTPFDLDGNPRFVDDPETDDTGNPPGADAIVDMGPYEFQDVRASLDIKPGACPNPLNVRSRGVLPMAIVGTVDFDVTQIELESLVLTRADGVGGAVTPLMGPPGPRIRVEDVATPFDGEPCDCHELEGDGIDDLSMKFDTQALVTELQLNDLPGSTMVELVVSGELSDSSRFSATDCVKLVPSDSGSGDGSTALVVPNPGPSEWSPSRRARPDMGLPVADSPRPDADAHEQSPSPVPGSDEHGSNAS